MLVVDVLPVLFRQLIMSNTQQSGVIIAPEFQFDLTLPWLKPRDSCELGLLALGR